MSSCLCHISPGAFAKLTASASAMAAIGAQLGPPIKLQMAANVAASASATMDMAGLAARLPNIQVALGGPLMQLAATLKVVPGTFNLLDPIKLSEQLAVSAGAVGAMPPAMFSAVAKLDLSAVLKVAAVARLVAQLNAAGLNPLSANFSATISAMASAHIAAPSLPPAALGKLQLYAGLPMLVQAMETLEIPLGNPGAVAAAFQARLSALASVTPPAFSVKLSLVLKAAAMVDAMATITAAFGASASANLGATLSATLSAVAAANLNVKAALPPLLPPLEDIMLGERIAGSSFMSVNFSGLTPPTISVLPAISAMIALKATLGLSTGAVALNVCTVCGSS